MLFDTFRVSFVSSQGFSKSGYPDVLKLFHRHSVWMIRISVSVKVNGIRHYSFIDLILPCFSQYKFQNGDNMTSKLATLRSKIKLSFFFCYILNIKLLIRSQYPPPDKKHSKLSYYLLILTKNKENVTFTWPTGVQNVLFFTNMKQALPESLRNRYQS